MSTYEIQIPGRNTFLADAERVELSKNEKVFYFIRNGEKEEFIAVVPGLRIVKVED